MTSDNHYENVVLRLTEMVAPDDPTLDTFTFVGCHIDGPAVLHLEGSQLVSCNLGGPSADALLWEIPLYRPIVVGAVLARNCHFEDCTFRNVGFAGPPALISRLKAEA